MNKIKLFFLISILISYQPCFAPTNDTPVTGTSTGTGTTASGTGTTGTGTTASGTGTTGTGTASTGTTGTGTTGTGTTATPTARPTEPEDTESSDTFSELETQLLAAGTGLAGIAIGTGGYAAYKRITRPPQPIIDMEYSNPYNSGYQPQAIQPQGFFGATQRQFAQDYRPPVPAVRVMSLDRNHQDYKDAKNRLKARFGKGTRSYDLAKTRVARSYGIIPKRQRGR